MTRRLPTILAAGFIVITLTRVAEFAATRMQAGWPGWVFSIGLGAGVYMAAYWTRDSITIREDGREDRRSQNVKDWAWGALVLFVLADSLFNLAEVWQSVKPAREDWLMIAATVLYGLFPTVAAAILGALQGHIDRLPKPPANEKTSVWLNIRKLAVAVVARRLSQVEQPQQLPQPPQPRVVDPVVIASKPQPEPVAPQPQPQPELSGTRLEVYRIYSDATASGLSPTNAAIGRQLNISGEAVRKHKEALERDGWLQSQPSPQPHNHNNGKAH
jgi:hypothetical protein